MTSNGLCETLACAKFCPHHARLRESLLYIHFVWHDLGCTTREERAAGGGFQVTTFVWPNGPQANWLQNRSSSIQLRGEFRRNCSAYSMQEAQPRLLRQIRKVKVG